MDARPGTIENSGQMYFLQEYREFLTGLSGAPRNIPPCLLEPFGGPRRRLQPCRGPGLRRGRAFRCNDLSPASFSGLLRAAGKPGAIFAAIPAARERTSAFSCAQQSRALLKLCVFKEEITLQGIFTIYTLWGINIIYTLWGITNGILCQ